MSLQIRSAQVVDYEKIRGFLLETKDLYPGIEYWWDRKVCPGIKLNKRVVLVVDIDDSVEGLFIGKPGTVAKICTLRLRKSIQSLRVGSDLLAAGLSYLVDSNTEKVYVTVSSGAEDGCQEFFKGRGFNQIAIEPNRYVSGVEEFVYSCSLKGDKK